MLPVTQAESTILDLVQPLEDTETVNLLSAINPILAQPVTSNLDFPYWDNAAMICAEKWRYPYLYGNCPQRRRRFYLTWLRHGEITSGRAARLLGISRLEAIDLMANLGISVFATQTRAELAGEVTNTWMDRDINGALGILLRALVDTPSLESIRSAFVNEC